MSNLRLPEKPINSAALVATVRGVLHYQNREHAHGEPGAIRERSTTDHQRRALARVGLEPDDWPRYRSLRRSYNFSAFRAAEIILNDRGRAR